MIWVVTFLYLMGMILFYSAADEGDLWPRDNIPIWSKLLVAIVWPFIVALGIVAYTWDTIFDKKWN